MNSKMTNLLEQIFSLNGMVCAQCSIWFDSNNIYTLSKTHYDWRKIEPATMKANFIHFWCVESEFIVKNQFHNWTSELGCIWHIFGKLGYFWLFLTNPDIQVTVNVTVNKAQFFCSSWLLPVLKCLKRAKFSKNVPNAP